MRVLDGQDVVRACHALFPVRSAAVNAKPQNVALTAGGLYNKLDKGGGA